MKNNYSDCLVGMATFLLAPLILSLRLMQNKILVFSGLAAINILMIVILLLTENIYMERNSGRSAQTDCIVIKLFIALIASSLTNATVCIAIIPIGLTETKINEYFTIPAGFFLLTAFSSAVIYKIIRHEDIAKIRPSIETFLLYFAEAIAALAILTMIIDADNSAFSLKHLFSETTTETTNNLKHLTQKLQPTESEKNLLPDAAKLIAILVAIVGLWIKCLFTPLVSNEKK